MIPFEEVPEDNTELANIEVEFPHLQPNTPESCPVSLADVVGYLRMESPDGMCVEADQLQFVRTALVSDHRYWIWSF